MKIDIVFKSPELIIDALINESESITHTLEFGTWLEGGSGGGGGENGSTFIPSVSQEGVISWTNDGELPNPKPVNIKGGDGKNGEDGLTPYIKNNTWWIGSTDTGIIAIGKDGKDGINGTNGINGINGSDGLTPYIKDNTWWIGSTNTEVIAKGERGEAATIEVGTVSTGEAGAKVIIENVGTPSNAILDFTIPKGDKGDSTSVEIIDNLESTSINSALSANQGRVLNLRGLKDIPTTVLFLTDLNSSTDIIAAFGSDEKYLELWDWVNQGHPVVSLSTIYQPSINRLLNQVSILSATASSTTTYKELRISVILSYFNEFMQRQYKTYKSFIIQRFANNNYLLLLESSEIQLQDDNRLTTSSKQIVPAINELNMAIQGVDVIQINILNKIGL